MHTVVCRHLGVIAYQEAWDLQQHLLGQLIEAKLDIRRGKVLPMPPNQLLFCYHQPVITYGKKNDKTHLRSSAIQLKKAGIVLSPTNRGGDITYHGPGQLVAYPILDLEPLCKDIHQYMRRLEEAIIGMLATYGVRGERITGLTGVWVRDKDKQPNKIASLGVRFSHWVSMHGLALNLTTDLTHFSHIVPCGISGVRVTSLCQVLGVDTIDLQVAEDRLLYHFLQQFHLLAVCSLEKGGGSTS